ncbi:MAG: hypothetical protein J6V99_00560 [Neisseriaceae bacterium]|nr:hypothetical protein [Neisseriaceae bacterium]
MVSTSLIYGIQVISFNNLNLDTIASFVKWDLCHDVFRQPEKLFCANQSFFS